jgi:periplasmic divalent cation tolerance protein
MTDIVEVIVTADNQEWLLDLSRKLVEERLVACGQHITPIRSIYRWDGAVQDDPEIRVAYHTRASLAPALIDRIKQEHPYDVPCILVIPIVDANPDYADWVRNETGPEGPSNA